MLEFTRPHHKLIQKALRNFNSEYLDEHRILFGGGTRIALELDEYRESIDIDFLCPDKESYRAVRAVVTPNSLGNIVKSEFEYLREIRLDRDGTRCFIQMEGVPIKLEFVSFANYEIKKDEINQFEVPSIDHQSCYLTKILANADRYNDRPYKDIFDLLTMFENWGEISDETWHAADNHYSFKEVFRGLEIACSKIQNDPQKYLTIACDELKIESMRANQIVFEVNTKFAAYIRQKKEFYIK
ncbi:hypothetical protein Asch01_01860 [Acinetobacter schindleri]|uniref:nucleotidyl transferase AbiEii/AbiGii toxin family protein n=1 Tax=Acinetobacter schindleri TaxID=108981 RepID=UPI0030986E34